MSQRSMIVCCEPELCFSQFLHDLSLQPLTFVVVVTWGLLPGYFYTNL